MTDSERLLRAEALVELTDDQDGKVRFEAFKKLYRIAQAEVAEETAAQKELQKNENYRRLLGEYGSEQK